MIVALKALERAHGALERAETHLKIVTFELY
jgi:hypothetical protein